MQKFTGLAWRGGGGCRCREEERESEKIVRGDVAGRRNGVSKSGAAVVVIWNACYKFIF
ncbi:hypothetical protein Lalb_Chr04g0258651 [Lupinus albus]|uniref:Uncharacterized protein n=1 Tax=Lupinus albus TaxID=3870 RepID=A0A6A4QS50_LUPAL|nr:hypothetical protein Lalb_Chr04g0258651 [Lupinus albus]